MRHIRQFSVLAGIAALAAVIPASVAVADVAADHAATVRPLLAEFCLKCHSTEAHKGDLDLERFATIDDVKRHPKVWQGVAEQLADELKFSDCLPAGLALRIADARLADPASLHTCLSEPLHGWNAT